MVELDNSQKILLEMINDMSKDFQAAFDVVRNKITNVSTKVYLTLTNQAPVGGAIPVSIIKIPKPKPFYEARDAKTLENFIFFFWSRPILQGDKL